MFDRLHIDYAGPIDGHYLLLVVDAFSKWLEISISKTKTTDDTLRALREIIARFGVPRVIVSDNDQTFKSDKFENFCKGLGIFHQTSPPYHPASNGQVERYVSTTKQALKKLRSQDRTESLHSRVQRFLFRLRIVNNASTNRTPAEMMIGRQLRSKLDLLNEIPVRNERISGAKAANDRYNVGDSVFARNYHTGPKWIPGTVEKVLGSNTCSVKVPQDTWKRQHNQMRRRNTSPQEEIQELTSDRNESDLLWYVSSSDSEAVLEEASTSDDSFHSVEHVENSGTSDIVESQPELGVDPDVLSVEGSISVNNVVQNPHVSQNEAEAVPVRRSSRERREPVRFGDWA